jgi:hypothetical protein
MGEEFVYAPFSIRADSAKPARILQDKEGKLWLEYYDAEGNVRRVPITLIVFPQELGDLKGQIPLADFIQKLRVQIVGSDIVILVRDTRDMLCARASVSIAAGGDGSISITVPSGETWEIQFTNHIGSGVDITLTRIEVSPDGGVTFYPVSASHLSNARLIVTGGNVIRALYHNAGTGAETAYLTIVGRRIQ